MYTDIKTLEDACKALGIEDPNSIIPAPVAGLTEAENRSMQNYARAMMVTKALNEGWTPNWDNNDEYKYYPWFYMQDSRFGYNFFDCFSSNSDAGSRLCFKSWEVAKYAAEQFIEIWKGYML